ncbi:hypothetical protein K493DRAFT_296270 [Basidiobolus meristosporus CBS 931.73]|uniref:Uncharacterized protein n=1 Tax=Basidiobolus meristosporus CBS 931.73 TaxID=1314790 RepID=A0A1Y1Z6G1_9FUNG|nr:hypothetical protein K493DRAFT_296270 [Basidiobolus meristosporus CBS 931.73]|eukprot:ORY05868.1 hypothetical protein K493DRAFT_296270 [Basidiobolus meristosporus CBS 931.73]
MAINRTSDHLSGVKPEGLTSPKYESRQQIEHLNAVKRMILSLRLTSKLLENPNLVGTLMLDKVDQCEPEHLEPALLRFDQAVDNFITVTKQLHELQRAGIKILGRSNRSKISIWLRKVFHYKRGMSQEEPVLMTSRLNHATKIMTVANHLLNSDVKPAKFNPPDDSFQASFITTFVLFLSTIKEVRNKAYSLL